MARKPTEIDSLRHEAARRRNIPTAEMESFFRPEEAQSPLASKHYPRARPLAPGARRTAEEPSMPELIWQGASIKITEEQQRQLAETGKLTLSDAQLVWRGKDEADWSDLIVPVPPIYIQEKIHPKAIIDDLKRDSDARREEQTQAPDLFADFNGISPEQRAEFYQHDQRWTNRMILGDSLSVMASLAEREGLQGKVQCIYLDPPYGIKFNSNWQVSTQSRDVKDGRAADISREPEQVKAFRDTWQDGIHSYLDYLRDRLMVARDLLTESGSIFVQIGDENVHRVRAVMDEVFGEENFRSQIHFISSSGLAQARGLATVGDYILWYARDSKNMKFRVLELERELTEAAASAYSMIEDSSLVRSQVAIKDRFLSDRRLGGKRYKHENLTKPGPGSRYEIKFAGKIFLPGKRWWGTTAEGMERLNKADRLATTGSTLWQIKYYNDYPYSRIGAFWPDTAYSFASNKVYIVQTNVKIIERCLLMTTDPGDLVLDPTCGSGTAAYAAEQWGRRWITIDTSRVALALARTRLMAARYPWYLLADSEEGRTKEAELTRKPPSTQPVRHDIRQGFVYERVPHIMLKHIANNAEIDDIWQRFEDRLRPLREQLTPLLPDGWLAGYRKMQKYTADVPVEIAEWEVPRHPETPWQAKPTRLLERIQTAVADGAQKKAERDLRQLNAELGREYRLDSLPERPADPWPENRARDALLEEFWRLRIARQQEIDASIAANADTEYLYDKPYEDKSRVRVAGPFTVESLSPARAPAMEDSAPKAEGRADFAGIVIDYLKSEGVTQQAKSDRISFQSVVPWPGRYIGAEGLFADENGAERRAGILIGPEYGTIGRGDLVEAAREAVDNRFHLLVACGFNFDAHTAELRKLGALPILQARINPDMQMAGELKNTGKGNMFVVFGEPDVEITTSGDMLQVEVKGVDVFDPNTGDIRSEGPDGIAAWFIDSDYNEESFFVRHAYFLGAGDPYQALKTTLKAEIDREAWESLYSATSRPFPRPEGGRIAVKVINHFGDEVMKVFTV